MPITLPTVTVCMLSYGDHFPLARRCLDSIVDTYSCQIQSVRVGLNAVGTQTRTHAITRLRELPCSTLIYEQGNALKYPVMRRMIHDPEHPIATPLVMWFDDDSCVRGNGGWWSKVLAAAMHYHVMGDLWTKQLEGRQAEGIKAQDWFAGKPLGPRARVLFATGGWWVARTETLLRYDYPFPAIAHNGGDVMLGALCHQQSLLLGRWREGVWINADEQGRYSKAPRRGVSQKPVWFDYKPGQPVSLAHHNFQGQLFDPHTSVMLPWPVDLPASRGVVKIPGL